MIILWIDPWTTTVWYAIVERNWHEISLLDYWVIKTQAKIALEHKLVEIWNDMKWLLEKYNPQRLGIEKLFFNTNITTWIAVSHARWVMIYETAKKWIQIFEYTPLQVKKAITSNGAAKKAQLQKAIQMIFKLDEIPTPDDAADAIWLAYMAALERDIS
jgi:crossover junction endodeoxyribonuclease RuvC